MDNRFLFSKEIYSKESLIKAAYDFIDDYYVHIDCDGKYFYVTLDRKDEGSDLTEDDFKNAILIHETRRIVTNKTSKLREIMYARAMASTIIESEAEDEELYDEDDAELILTDWFDYAKG